MRPRLDKFLILPIVALAACAMSRSAFERFSSRVHERNEKRYREAEAEMREAGYTFADDEKQTVRPKHQDKWEHYCSCSACRRSRTRSSGTNDGPAVSVSADQPKELYTVAREYERAGKWELAQKAYEKLRNSTAPQQSRMRARQRSLVLRAFVNGERPETAQMKVLLHPPSGTESSPRTLKVPAVDGCRFLFAFGERYGTIGRLRGRLPDGDTLELFAFQRTIFGDNPAVPSDAELGPVRLASTPSGEFVFVNVFFVPVRRHDVTVRRTTCIRGPNPEPDPRMPVYKPVVVADERPSAVPMIVEEEIVEMECTTTLH